MEAQHSALQEIDLEEMHLTPDFLRICYFAASRVPQIRLCTVAMHS
jgi:hypothetical protein